MGNLVTGIWRFYRDGFRSMTWGRTLWLIIGVKLFVLFFVLRLLLFPDFLKQATDETPDIDKGEYVSRELIRRSITPILNTDIHD